MTIRTEADEMLRAAIVAHAQATGLVAADELLNHYVIVCHWIGPDDNNDYSIEDEGMPQHIVVGLLCEGLEMAQEDDADD